MPLSRRCAGWPISCTRPNWNSLAWWERSASAPKHTSLVLRIEAPDALPPLPTAIETVAYYIALEALSNIEKHAGARSCRLCLTLVNGSTALHPPLLELDITDDGSGLPAGASHGLGVLSMQARAAEAGGTCRIASNPQGGTRVSVRLPCPSALQ